MTRFAITQIIKGRVAPEGKSFRTGTGVAPAEVETFFELEHLKRCRNH